MSFNGRLHDSIASICVARRKRDTVHQMRVSPMYIPMAHDSRISNLDLISLRLQSPLSTLQIRVSPMYLPIAQDSSLESRRWESFQCIYLYRYVHGRDSDVVPYAYTVQRLGSCAMGMYTLERIGQDPSFSTVCTDGTPPKSLQCMSLWRKISVSPI